MLKLYQFISIVIHSIWLNRFSYGLDCYQCSNVQNITDCHNVVQCHTDEYCYTDTSGQGMYTQFTLGCRPKQTCLAAQQLTTTTPLMSLIGRSLTPSLDCSQCCAIDACNKRLCTFGTQALGNSQCEDDPTVNCPSVASLFNLCGDIHHAKLRCKKFCGLCNVTDGGWSSWQLWSSCSLSCGPGTQDRVRSCDNPAPRDGGLPCVGESTQQTTCNPMTCPVHGQWNRWSSWGSCSVSCGIGLERRDRSCSNPYPGPDGEPCWGDARDDRACFETACADGNWSNWSSWGSCSASCLGGIQKRTRACTNPVPSKFGHDCIGNSEETQACNSNYCPETHGRWSSWSSWSSCSNNYVKKRHRLCTNPRPSQHGQNCAGSNEEIDVCIDNILAIRLVGGPNSHSGRVEVKYGNEWGTVCDDGFNANVVKVVCRSLGLSTSGATFTSASRNQGSGSILLDDLVCKGTERSLDECGHSPWGSNDCIHLEDVVVTCG